VRTRVTGIECRHGRKRGDRISCASARAENDSRRQQFKPACGRGDEVNRFGRSGKRLRGRRESVVPDRVLPADRVHVELFVVAAPVCSESSTSRRDAAWTYRVDDRESNSISGANSAVGRTARGLIAQRNRIPSATPTIRAWPTQDSIAANSVTLQVDCWNDAFSASRRSFTCNGTGRRELGADANADRISLHWSTRASGTATPSPVRGGGRMFGTTDSKDFYSSAGSSIFGAVATRSRPRSGSAAIVLPAHREGQKACLRPDLRRLFTGARQCLARRAAPSVDSALFNGSAFVGFDISSAVYVAAGFGEGGDGVYCCRRMLTPSLRPSETFRR
jgi:hypothetical protein